MSFQDDELAREIQTHLDLETAEGVARGLPEDVARRRARIAFGGVAQVREDVRRCVTPLWFDEVRRDLRLAVRGLLSNRLFTIASIGTLALGIGATTAVFSVVRAVLVKPLAYSASSDGLVRPVMNVPAATSPSGRPLRTSVTLTSDELALLLKETKTLSGAGLAGPDLLSLRGHEGAARMMGARASASVFGLLGATPALGRTLRPADETAGAEPVVVISDAAWRRYFGGDREVINRTVIFDSVLGTRREIHSRIVGVMPPTFAFPSRQTEFWMPFTASSTAPVRAPRGPVLGMLREGVSPTAAAAELATLLRGIRNDKPDVSYDLVLEKDEQARLIRPALLVLTAAVAFLLLIACVNVANLLLARAEGRRHETAIRTALGAGWARLFRQSLIESTVLAALGGVAGIGLAFSLIHLFRHLTTSALTRIDVVNAFTFPRSDEISVDAHGLLFATALSLGTGLIFGVIPALRQAATTPVARLRGSRVSTTDSAQGARVRGTLVVVQVASTVALLIGAALLGRSFMRLADTPPGYRPDHLLTFQVSLPPDRYAGDQQRSFADDLVARLRGIPGVRATAYANQLPTVAIRDTAGGLWKTADPNRTSVPDAADARLVSPGYLDAMGIRVVAGRSFTAEDGPGSPRVLLINELLAGQEFAESNPLGQQVFVGRDPAPWTIIGVVENVREFELSRTIEPQFFVSLRQWPGSSPLLFMTGAYYVVRVDDDPTTIVPTVRMLVQQMEPAAALFHVAPMEQLLGSTMALPRAYAVLMTAFAMTGLLLAIVGVGGVVAYSVAQRTHDIGVRMALGATGSIILRSVLRHFLGLTTIGAIAGLMLAAMLGRYLRSLLYGVEATDAATYIAVSALFLITAAVACALPARKAARIDPLTAIRAE